ncbi:NADPH-dependent FMN reductase [Leucobacter chromiireducens]|uniref:NADPH-dependent FMN reductase n=1 Tax=Leucobacter chromiireducens TaxID=283877 RepID=UPI000F63C9FC|nr:NADPH-dependent FMN reductase [Leucobacter chromiireducens]
MRIGLLSGSIASDSINTALLGALAHLIDGRAELVPVEITELPVYGRDADADHPAAARAFKELVRGLDGLVIATPEYNRAIPAALKNALEWGSRPWGENIFAGLPVGIVGASPGTIGTALAQQQLRAGLAFLDAPTLAQPEVYLRWHDGMLDDAGRIADAGTRAFLEGWSNRFLAHVALHARAAVRS